MVLARSVGSARNIQLLVLVGTDVNVKLDFQGMIGVSANRVRLIHTIILIKVKNVSLVLRTLRHQP